MEGADLESKTEVARTPRRTLPEKDPGAVGGGQQYVLLSVPEALRQTGEEVKECKGTTVMALGVRSIIVTIL